MSDPLAAAREALAGEPAWLVGGAVRDRLLGRPTSDYDVAVAGDPAGAARRLARAVRGAPFSLSDQFGAWRVMARDRSWQVDLVPLQGGSLERDLAARDFTFNAMAEPLAGGELIDPHGGAADTAARRVRMVSEAALAADPLRALRAVRFAVELDMELEPATGAAVRLRAPELARVSAERVFAELKRIVCAPAVLRGLELMERHGLTAAVLPELLEQRGVEQNVFHHLDVYDHTLAVLQAVLDIERGRAGAASAGLGEYAEAVAALLAEPLADELTRGQALRFAALLHDVAKPATRGRAPDGRVTFLGHDKRGAETARAILKRLKTSERLAEYVAILTRHHLRLGFLVHERPLSRRSAWRYLTATAPYEVDVTVLTVADRLATRGRSADDAIPAHLELAREMLGHAFARRAVAGRPPLIRGDELARELGIEPGPKLGELLAQLEEDRFTGDVTTRAEAIARARSLLSSPSGESPRGTRP
jgi:poly(A) polymerase